MGKLEEFRIEFMTSPAVFFSGQWVVGAVHVTLKEAMKMRGIRIKFEGKSKVHWTESRTEGSGDNQRTVTDHYNNGTKYFENTTTVFGNDKGSSADNPVLAAGKYTYPFQFLLPQNIPCSFEGENYGYIRYWCKATIDKPWKFDEETKAAFTVATFYDLNLVPRAMQPATDKDHKYHCCCCCKSGPITATINIPGRCGFVPGEKIPFQGEISNLSTIKVKGWKAKLIQEITYIAHGHRGTHEREENTTLASYESSEEIPEGEEQHIACQLEVPPVPSSELIYCDFIIIKYKIKLVVILQRSTNLDVDTTVIIGNVPLRSEWSHIAPPMPGPSMPIMGPAPPMPTPVMPGQMPPGPGMPGQMPPLPGIPGQMPPGPGMPPAPYPAAYPGPAPPAGYPPAPAPGAYPSPAQPMPGYGADFNTNYGAMGAAPPPMMATPAAPPLEPTAPTVAAPYPDMPPPSYNECFADASTLKDDDDGDHMRSDPFKPMYPTYNWN